MICTLTSFAVPYKSDRRDCRQTANSLVSVPHDIICPLCQVQTDGNQNTSGSVYTDTLRSCVEQRQVLAVNAGGLSEQIRIIMTASGAVES